MTGRTKKNANSLRSRLANAELLMINYRFPPSIGMGATRNRHFYNEACKYFKGVKVLTTINGKIRTPSFQTQTNVKYIPTFDYQTIKLLLSRISFSDTKKINQKNRNARKLQSIFRKFPLNILLGEGGVVYILFSLLYIVINRNKVDFVYSSFSPYADHLLAYFLKKLCPRVTWIADFRDIPFVVTSGSPDQVRMRTDKFKIAKSADYITTVSHGLIDKLKAIKDNPILLPNGIGEYSSTDKENLSDNFNDRFNISYTGSIYPDFSSTDILCRAVHELIAEGKIDRDQLSLNYAGRDTFEWDRITTKYFLQDVNNCMGFCEQDLAIEIQEKSQINVLLTWYDNNFSGILTGKLYEYIRAQRPILVLSSGARDPEILRIITDLGQGTVIINAESNIDKIRDYIINLYELWSQRVQPIIESEKLEKYRWTNTFVSAFQEMSQRN